MLVHVLFYNYVGWCLMIVDAVHDCYIYISLISLGLLGELFHNLLPNSNI